MTIDDCLPALVLFKLRLNYMSIYSYSQEFFDRLHEQIKPPYREIRTTRQAA